MTYMGVVRQGKIELPKDAALPEGASVRIELVNDPWLVGWDELTEQITEEWQGTRSMLDVLYESRR